MDIKEIENYIVHNRKIEMPVLQKQFNLKYSEVTKVLDEFEKRGIIKYLSGFTYEINSQAIAEQTGKKEDNSAPRVQVRRRSLRERLMELDNDNDDGEPFSPHNLEMFNDDDDDEDDDEEESRLEYLERRRKEILERLRQNNDNEQAVKERQAEMTETIRNECKKMPCYSEDDQTFSVKMNVTYPDGMPFRVKTVEIDGSWYISDCGRTIEYLLSHGVDGAIISTFESDLQTELIRVINKEICTSLDDVDDIIGESAYLLKVVNGIVAHNCFN